MESCSRVTLLICLFAAVFFIACKDKPEGKAADELLMKIARLECQQVKLKEEMSILWDSVAIVLEDHLPESMPHQERSNMISVRNAGMIRMFESYDSLGTGIQSMIDVVENQDQKAVSEFALMQEELKMLEQERLKAFEELEKTNPARLEVRRTMHMKMLEDPCNFQPEAEIKE